MQKLHCTYTEYRQQPVQEMAVFEAFAAGEASGEKALSDANSN